MLLDFGDVEIVIAVARTVGVTSAGDGEAELSALFLVALDERGELLSFLEQIALVFVARLLGTRMENLSHDDHLDLITGSLQGSDGFAVLAIDQGHPVHRE